VKVKKKYGRKGKSVDIVVPAGTEVIDAITGEVLLDLVKVGKEYYF